MIQHIAFEMDGNRRWAKEHGSKIIYGSKSKEAIKTVIGYCLQHQISYLSLYAFSLENFKRSPEESAFVFQATIDSIRETLPEFMEQEIKVRFVGERSLFPAQVKEAIDTIETATQEFRKLQINILYFYGSQQEITHAARILAEKVSAGELTTQDVTPELFKQYLWTYPFPEPDIIVRTGKVNRLSNFLLYQAAYSELYFPDCLWPDLSVEHLNEIVDRFKKTSRRFGL